MKVRSALKLRCAHCYMVRRGKKMFVYCKEIPKHKQRQGYFHTMARNNFMNEFCSPCNYGNINSMTTRYNSTSLVSPINEIETSLGRISLSGSEVSSVLTSKIDIKYNPAVGIFSIVSP